MRWIRRRGRTLLVRIVITSILLFFLFHLAAFSDIAAVFERVEPRFIAPYYFLFFIGLGGHVVRWLWLLKGWGIKIQFRLLLRWTIIGLFLNIFIPGGLGGDAYRIYSGARSTGNLESVSATIFFERLISYISLVCLGLGALVARANYVEDRLFWILLGSILIILITILFILATPCIHAFLIKQAVKSIFLQKIKLENWMESFHLTTRQLQGLLGAFLISAVIQFIEVILYFLVANAIQLPVMFSDLFLFVPLLMLALLIPITINGIGVRETVFLIFASRWGISQADAVAFSLTVFFLTVAGSLFGGPLYFINRKQITTLKNISQSDS